METKQILTNKVEASNDLIVLLLDIKQPLLKYLTENELKFTTNGDLYKKNRDEIQEILKQFTAGKTLQAYLKIMSWDAGDHISGIVFLKVKTSYPKSKETVKYIEKTQRIWDIDDRRPTVWHVWESRKTTVKEQENYLSILEDVRAEQRKLEKKNREYKNLLIWEE